MRRRSNYYFRERRRGRTFSLLLHLFILLLCVLGLPSFLISPPPEEPDAITVELVPVTGITNIKPSERPEVAKEEKTSAQKKSAPPVKVAEETPPEEKRVPLPTPEEKKEQEKQPKPEKKKPENKKPKPKQDNLEAVLKAVKETAEKEDKKQAKDESSSKSKNTSTQYNPQLPMSISEIGAIQSQFSVCWNPPIGAKEAQDLQIVVHIELEPDGTVTKVEMGPGQESRYETDSFFRAAADSAMRAVRECSPLKNLPPEKYQTWRDMDLTFDPKAMLL